jgi:catechol 2,3-dioxygenase-like lactoylglutathione lyase family enzyme
MTVSIRYIVNDIEEAIPFYTTHLGFSVDMHPGPGFAMLSRGDLRLLLNKPGGGGGAGQGAADGTPPEPGGWNRFQFETKDLDALALKLRAAGVKLRSDVITGNGGKQVVAEDPSGNPVELFQPF